MHRGRVYPFNPQFWLDESHFWPAYCAWKMTLFVPLNFNPLWNPLSGGPYQVVSDPATTLDGRSVTYHWSTTWTSEATDFTVTVKRVMVSGVMYGHWHAQLLLGVVVLADAYYYGPYADLTFATYANQFFPVDSPIESGLQIFLTLEPATYIQGGSPYE